MADISGSFFEYGGFFSSEHNLILVNIDTERVTSLYGERKSIAVFNKRSNKNFLIDDDYTSSPLVFEIDIIRQDETPIEPLSRRSIEKWLFQDKQYKRLYISEESEVLNETYEIVNGVKRRNYLNCRFINPIKIEANGGVVGYRVKVETDSDMFIQDPISVSYPVNGESGKLKTVSLLIDTDSIEYTYPIVTIDVGSVGGTITISNSSDDGTRLTTFINTPPNAHIVMQGEFNYINEPYYEIFHTGNFIRLVDGTNTFIIDGDVLNIGFEYSAKRMI